MTGHHNFRELTAHFSESRKAKIVAKTEQLKVELAQLESSQFWSTYQAQIARQLNCSLSDISQLEEETEIYIANLRKAIASIGGELSIIMRFPDREIEIKEFAELKEIDRE
ncbi:XRE family transcriptional regulator [Spirulina sp. 06S082]|uniref:XRE family transcriptional regulator n=1 Tax=Spirulina sp. 06S082 TaxID=3110248 RepID=UPI002B217B0A|nr:XRE family transcriptional regulator [Spirulina sp. 06S082]MEA5468651.1 XRE family transcriptional regulator [Spirulina sp. 06S082]